MFTVETLNPIWLAITLGLGSSFTHCAGMCGPIHLAIQKNGSASAPYYYHLGRVIGYSLIGFFLGSILRGQELMLPPLAKQITATLLAALYLLGAWSFWKGGHSIEKFFGKFFPRKIYHKFLFEKKARALLPAGLMASLLPCPTTVAALGYALWLGNPASSAMAMFAFGVSTMPFFALLGLKPMRNMINFSGWMPKVFALLFCVLSIQKIWMVWFAASPQCH